MATLKVLYVDDDPDIREVAELSLQMDPGIEVRVAESGHAALAVLAGWRPDILMLDVMMPGMDGPTVLEAVRNLADSAPAAIFITARALPSEVAQLVAHGVLGVITKPFDPLKLAAEVRALAARA